jgi:hypothetical protein
LAGVNGAKGELADQAGLAGNGIVVDHSARIEVVAIERDDIAMASGGIDDAARRQVGEAGAEHEMVRVGDLDGAARQREITLRDVRGEVVAIAGEPGAPWIGAIGRLLISGAALVGRVSAIRCVDVRKRRQTIPGAGRRLPARIENRKVAMSLLEPIERGLAARTCRRQAEKKAEQLLGAAPVWTPA